MRKAQALARGFYLIRSIPGSVSVVFRHSVATLVRILWRKHGSTSPEARFWNDASTDEIGAKDAVARHVGPSIHRRGGGGQELRVLAQPGYVLGGRPAEEAAVFSAELRCA